MSEATAYARDLPNSADLDAAIEIIIVDAYGDDEQYTAFLTVIGEQTPLPIAATLLGTPVTVTAFDYRDEARGVAQHEAVPEEDQPLLVGLFQPIAAARRRRHSPRPRPIRWTTREFGRLLQRRPEPEPEQT